MALGGEGGAAPRTLLTEADVPKLPEKLLPDATEEEQAERARLMDVRRRLKKRLTEQGRDHRDHASRKRPAVADDTARRTAQRLFDEARRRHRSRTGCYTSEKPQTRARNPASTHGTARISTQMRRPHSSQEGS